MNQVKVTERVQKQLFELQDLQYRDFQAKLLLTIEKETVIGVRMPVLRKFAKGYGKTEEAKEFLKILPHQYYDENVWQSWNDFYHTSITGQPVICWQSK